MSEQYGTVISLKENKALVQLDAHSSCGHCGACSGGKRQDVVAEADNKIGAQVGQRVKVEMQAQALFKATLVVYFIPLCFLIVGVALGSSLAARWGFGSADLFGAGLGFVFLAVSFLAVRYYENKARRTQLLQPVITYIVDKTY